MSRRTGIDRFHLTRAAPERGAPLWLPLADTLMREVGAREAVPLSWHRLRHTWAEGVAASLLEDRKDGRS